MSKKLIIVLIMCFYSVISLFADNTYFVSATSGSDSDGYGTSADTPCKTLEYAWSKAVSASGNSVINIMTDLDMEDRVINDSGKKITIQSYNDGSNKRYTVYPKKSGPEPTYAVFDIGNYNGGSRSSNGNGFELRDLILDGSKFSNPSSCNHIVANHSNGESTEIVFGENLTIQNFNGVGGILDHQSNGRMCRIASTCKVTNNTFTKCGFNIGGGSTYSISGEISNNTLSGGTSALIRIGGAVATGPAISNLTVKNNVIASKACAVWISSPSNETRKIIWSGDVYIFDNKDADGNQKNFFIGNSQRFNIDSSSSFGSKSKIGLISEKAPNATTDIDITSTNNKDYSSVFVSDDPNYFITNVSNAIKLVVHKHQWSFFITDNRINAYCTNPVGAVKCEHYGKQNLISLSVELGFTYSLKASVLPSDATNKNVDWTSSDTDVLTVDEKGLIHGIKAGPATVRATSTDGSNKYAECRVIVQGEPE